MDNNVDVYRQPKRWFMCICILLMHAALMGAMMISGAYAEFFIGGWGVEQGLFVQLTMVGFLTGAIFSIPMGMLADRFGVPLVLGIGMVFSFAASVARIFCVSFWPLYVCHFFMGMGLAGMNANSVKFLRAWFGERQVTTAMTLYVSGAGIGVTAAMASAGMMPTPDQAYMATAIVFAICCVIWFAFARMPKGVAVMKDQYSMAAVKTCFTNKPLILLSICMMLSMSASASYSGNVPIALQAKGFDPAAAALMASAINFAGMPSNWISGPVADKLQRMKPVMAVMTFVGTGILIVAWLMPASEMTLPLMVVGAFISWGNIGIIKGSVGMIPNIKPEYMGTAGGLQTFFQNLAAFCLPSFVFTPLCGGNMVMFFVICGISVILAGAVFMITPELGLKGKIHQEPLQDEQL